MRIIVTKRGRPSIQITEDNLKELRLFINTLSFLIKKQNQFKEIWHKQIHELSNNEIQLVKSNLREFKNHTDRRYMYDVISLKIKTNIPLTSLEKEILGYDLNNRDDFFNCQNAINTYIKLDKVSKQDIERIDLKARQEKINKTKKELTEAQKLRNAHERQKYFVGGTLQQLKKVFSFEHLSDIDFLQWLAVSALTWKGADQLYNLTQDKYFTKIEEIISEDFNNVTGFMEKVKSDNRQ